MNETVTPRSVNSEEQLRNRVSNSGLDLVKISLSLKLLNSPESLTALDKKFLSAWRESLISGKALAVSDDVKAFTLKHLSKRDLKSLSELFKFTWDESFSNFALSDFTFELCQILNDGYVKHVEELLISNGSQPLEDKSFSTNNHKKYLLDMIEISGWQIGNKWSPSEIENIVNLVCVGRIDDADKEYGQGLKNGKYRQSLKEFIE